MTDRARTAAPRPVRRRPCRTLSPGGQGSPSVESEAPPRPGADPLAAKVVCVRVHEVARDGEIARQGCRVHQARRSRLAQPFADALGQLLYLRIRESDCQLDHQSPLLCVRGRLGSAATHTDREQAKSTIGFGRAAIKGEPVGVVAPKSWRREKAGWRAVQGSVGGPFEGPQKGPFEGPQKGPPTFG